MLKAKYCKQSTNSSKNMEYSVESEAIKGLVSIIIPTHNRVDLICETLDSIREQSYKYIEVIIVDDHSKDFTVEAINAYIQKNKCKNIKVFENRGQGACAARNMGIDKSKGEFIQFFDDDDLMLNDHIEKKVCAIQDNKYDYCTCDYSFFDNITGKIIGHKIVSKIDDNCASRLLTLSFPTPCFLCKRDAIKKIGYWNEDIKKLQDMAYFHRLYMYDMKGCSVPEELFKVRVHEGSMTANNVVSPLGYRNQMHALTCIEKEWKYSGKPEKDAIMKIIHFMKFTIGRNMYKKGFKRQGFNMLIKTIFGNLRQSIKVFGLFVKYNTIHITTALATEFGTK